MVVPLGTPESSTSIGFSITNHPAIGVPTILETPMYMICLFGGIILPWYTHQSNCGSSWDVSYTHLFGSWTGSEERTLPMAPLLPPRVAENVDATSQQTRA